MEPNMERTEIKPRHTYQNRLLRIVCQLQMAVEESRMTAKQVSNLGSVCNPGTFEKNHTPVEPLCLVLQHVRATAAAAAAETIQPQKNTPPKSLLPFLPYWSWPPQAVAHSDSSSTGAPFIEARRCSRVRIRGSSG
jgi:hypothetical protein